MISVHHQRRVPSLHTHVIDNVNYLLHVAILESVTRFRDRQRHRDTRRQLIPDKNTGINSILADEQVGKIKKMY